MSGKALSGLQVHQKMYTKHHLQGGVGVGTAGNRMGTWTDIFWVGCCLAPARSSVWDAGPRWPDTPFYFICFKEARNL